MSILEGKEIELLCEFQGGSHLYGLNTPASDIDVRGVFANTDPDYILGTKRHDESRKQISSEKEDIVYKELSHFMRLLKASNTEALEILFAKESAFSLMSHSMSLIRTSQDSFVDSERLYNCLRGYMQGELRLALGERKGQIGGKRYEAVQKYGFSPKNFTQLFRLAYVGEIFFKENRFPVNIKDEKDPAIWEALMAIKTQPENFSKDELTLRYAEAELSLEEAFNNRAKDRKFDEEVANETLLAIYIPHLEAAKKKLVQKCLGKVNDYLSKDSLLK